ncbi:deoxyribose-phosphate aldolase [Thalassotalea hakodatensis]|uniref:deoxyribose-phosphate aldolase n=1 Tax=Thalassotalea hakodatensis TaxID=3030492 RepID=UPI002573574E|nr:deoxyribose-phosphate aldolase [Thalassotalea hakodatensis]
MTEQQQTALLALSLVDLTSLRGDESQQEIIELCEQAATKHGDTAAICIYPQYISIAKQHLAKTNKQIKIATVTNFPHGGSDVNQAVKETAEAVSLGADEVDVVFPYNALIAGDENVGYELVNACKQACGKQVTLKVIIESGKLKTDSLIQRASEIAIDAGADFIKTSTGKVDINATPEAAKIMLSVIENVNPNVGFKAAGGVKTLEDATKYLTLVMDTLGASWLDQTHFRFGASGLLDNLLATIEGKVEQPSSERY